MEQKSQSACAMPESSKISHCFTHPEEAPSGMARLYVFRPDFSHQYINDKPILTIDNKTTVVLGLLTYTSLDLSLGKHQMKLSSGKNDAAIWNFEGEINVHTPGRFYLAIWNAEQIDSIQPPSATAWATAITISAVATAATGNIQIYEPKSEANLKEYAKYEFVEEQEALSEIKHCTLSPAISVSALQ